jgi:hypothetical protein
MRRQLLCSLFATCGALTLTVAGPSFAALLNQVATTGHDQDIVFEAGLAAGAVGANGEIGSRQFFEDGATSATDDGLPQTLPPFVSGAGNTIIYAFQPFAQNNILKFDSTTAVKTLTLTTPAAYQKLAAVFSGGSLATATEVAGLTYTIHCGDNTTQTGVVNVPDWGAVTTLPAGTERLFIADRTTANATSWPVTSDNNTTANRWAIYLSEITPNSGANIVSVDFGPVSLNDADGLLNSGDDVVVFGLAGALVPEPSAWALTIIGATVLRARRRSSHCLD